jgi:DnaJ-class molecular chaperone
MPTRSPYAILGIARSASGSEIRTAYRTLALRHHPDVTSGPDAGPFIEVQQAYEVLRDPASRRAWDEAHSAYSERRHETLFTSPIIDLGAASYADARHARTVAPDFAITPSAPESLFDTFFDAFDMLAAGFVHEGRVGGGNNVFFDLVLTPAEATRGGQFSFTVPLRGPSGEVVEPEVHLLVPPGVHDGQRATLPLGHLGLPRGEVTVTVRVEQ